MGFLRRVAGSVGGTVEGRTPFPDLQPFAAEHGLAFLGSGQVFGVSGVSGFGDSANLAYGTLPGGEDGALAHVKQLTGHSLGQNSNARIPQYAAHTRIAVPVPEAVGPLQRFRLTNSATHRSLAPEVDQFNPSVKMRDLGFEGGMGWRMTLSPNADTGLVQRLLGGGFGSGLREVPGNFALRFNYGSLLLVSGDGYATGHELDELCGHLSGLGKQLRETVITGAGRGSFDEPLPEPSWLGEAVPQRATKRFLGMTIQLGGGAAEVASDRIGGLGEPLMEPWRTSVAHLARSIGGALEDPLAFHRAFPALPTPGRAYAVLRAPLAAGGTGRIALYTEGMGGGGPVAVVCRVNDDVPVRRPPIGDDATEMKVAINGNLMAAWTYGSADTAASDIPRLSQRAWEMAESNGWVPA
jgi:hypothetical protein